MRSVVGFLSQRGLHGDPLLTQDFQRRRLRGCRNLYKKDLLGHFGCVNAIEFSNNGGQWLVSGKSTPFPAPRLPAPLHPPLSLSLATLLLPSVPTPSLLNPPSAVGRFGVKFKPLQGEGGEGEDVFCKKRPKMVDRSLIRFIPSVKWSLLMTALEAWVGEGARLPPDKV